MKFPVKVTLREAQTHSVGKTEYGPGDSFEASEATFRAIRHKVDLAEGGRRRVRPADSEGGGEGQ